MAILVDKKSKVIVQGITGGAGKFHCERMLAYGTNIVGGTSPGKGGQKVCDKPVFDTKGRWGRLRRSSTLCRRPARTPAGRSRTSRRR
jgi:hypothetical protein